MTTTNDESERIANFEKLGESYRAASPIEDKFFADLVSERLTNSEIESLRQDLKDKTACLKKAYPNLRQTP